MLAKRRSQHLAGAALLVPLLPLLASCRQRDDARGEALATGEGSRGRLVVVATITPLADIAKRVAGDRAEVLTLIPAGASEHSWEPSPRQVARMRQADILFQVGLGFDTWASGLLGGGRNGLVTVDGSEGVDLIGETGSQSPRHGSAVRGAEDPAAPQVSPAVGNPHYWLDPRSLRPAVGRLAEALAERDPGAAAIYRERAARTLADLEALDEELSARTARFTSRSFVGFHSAWDYFARRYDLEVIASIEESPGKEPGPRHIAEIVKLVRQHHVRAVFAEPQLSPKAAEVVAAECGVPVRVLDPLGGPGMLGREDYVSLMRYNVGVMESVLR